MNQQHVLLRLAEDILTGVDCRYDSSNVWTTSILEFAVFGSKRDEARRLPSQEAYVDVAEIHILAIPAKEKGGL